MSVALVTMVRDEIDLISPFVRHTAAHVDQLFIADHGSADGTRDVLVEMASEYPIVLSDITEPGYYQSRYMTELARRAQSSGHSWVLPADVDETWYVVEQRDRRIGDYLAGLAPDVQIVEGALYNHIPTARDDAEEENPFRRIQWRKREVGAMPKVCCRVHSSLVIDQGNHSARYGRNGSARALRVPGLALRHFSWRSKEQYAHKILVGREAYAATNLPDDIGVHWRMWDGASEEEIQDHFLAWFWSDDPEADDELVFDPAPVLG